MKRAGKLLSGLLISAFFLYLSFRRADVREVFAIIRRANIEMLLIALFIVTLGFMIKTYRWKLLGEKYNNLKWVTFLRAGSIGYMTNLFLPLRAGDVFQGYFLSRNTLLTKSYTLSTVFLERLVDLMAVLAVIIIGSFFIVFPETIPIEKIMVLTAMLIGGIFLIIQFHKHVAKILFVRNENIIIKELSKFYGHIIESLKFLKDKQVLFKAIPLTFFKWFIVYGCAAMLVLKAVDIHIGYFAALLVIALTSLSAVIPVSPGQIGVWEYFCVVSLGIFDVDLNRALSYAVLAHSVAVLPTVVFGMYFLIDELFVKKDSVLKEAIKQNKT